MRTKLLSPLLFAVLLVIAILAWEQTRSPVSADMQKSFEELVSITNLNKDLRITNKEVEWDRFGSDILIQYQNFGKKPIFMSIEEASLFVKIYSIKDNLWIEIKDNAKSITSDGEKGFVISPRGTIFESDSIMVHPSFPTVRFDPEKKEFIRVLIKGEYLDGDERTGVFVGTYVDLYVLP